MADPETVSKYLAKSLLGAGMTLTQLETLAELAEVRNYANGELILGDQHCTDLYVIGKGTAEVKGRTGDQLTVLEQGMVIGEVAFVDKKERSADVYAQGDTLLLVFPGDLMERLRNGHEDVLAQLMFNLAQILCKKLRFTTRLAETAIL